MVFPLEAEPSLAAPFIAKFYNDISLTPIIRVTSLTIIISGVKGIQQSYVSKNMLFGKIFGGWGLYEDGQFTTESICTEINDLHQSEKKISEIMKLTGLSRASVHSYLPYTKGLYNAAEISLNAERCRTYKIRQVLVSLRDEHGDGARISPTHLQLVDEYLPATYLPLRC